MIPGVIYGKSVKGSIVKQLVTVPVKELVNELRSRGRSFENTVYEIIVGSTEQKYFATPRQTQFNPGVSLVHCLLLLSQRHDFKVN